MSGDDRATELSEAIEAVRAGLQTAAEAGAGEGLRFQVEQVELELTVELRRSARGGTGVQAWVVRADAGRERSAGSTHRLKIVLQVAEGNLIHSARPGRGLAVPPPANSGADGGGS
ncbi:trypco2 family protein [Streptomyces sp. NPDC058145]|uniref:trypco2 family protein n=1 Tax=Streptomyces sp. NPDC058145 TaxID=3346356 RepID=UPI0036EDC442